MHFPTNDDTMGQTIKNSMPKINDTLYFTRTQQYFTVSRIEYSVEDNKCYIQIYATEQESGFNDEIYFHGGFLGDYMNDTVIVTDYDLGI